MRDRSYKVVYYDYRIFYDGIRHHFILKERNDVYDVIYFDGKDCELFNVSSIRDYSRIDRRDEDNEWYNDILDFIKSFLLTKRLCEVIKKGVVKAESNLISLAQFLNTNP